MDHKSKVEVLFEPRHAVFQGDQYSHDHDVACATLIHLAPDMGVLNH
jgi:hypothetical protein